MLRNTTKTGKTRSPTQSPADFPRNPRKDEPSTPAAIFNYLQKLRNGEVRPLNEAKLLLVGQGRRQNLPHQTPHRRQIQPQRSANRRLSITALGILQSTPNPSTQRLGLRRTGNLPRHPPIFPHQTQPLHPRLELRPAKTKIPTGYWLKPIESFGDASPVIIVGNKCDEQPSLDINRTSLAAENIPTSKPSWKLPAKPEPESTNSAPPFTPKSPTLEKSTTSSP